MFELKDLHSSQCFHFKHILKEVIVCFSSSVYNNKYFWHLTFQNKIWPFSVKSLQRLVLEFEISTTDTRKLRVAKHRSLYANVFDWIQSQVLWLKVVLMSAKVCLDIYPRSPCWRQAKCVQFRFSEVTKWLCWDHGYAVQAGHGVT